VKDGRVIIGGGKRGNSFRMKEKATVHCANFKCCLKTRKERERAVPSRVSIDSEKSDFPQ